MSNFPDDFAESALWSDNLDGYDPPEPFYQFPTGVIPTEEKIKEEIDWILEQIENQPTAPPFELPPIDTVNADDDCKDINLTLKMICRSIERGNNIHMYGWRIIHVQLLAIVTMLQKIDGTFDEKFPHREFQVGSAIDMQQHLHDGFDAIVTKLSQMTEAATGVKTKESDIDDIEHTSPDKDKTTRGAYASVGYRTKPPTN